VPAEGLRSLGNVLSRLALLNRKGACVFVRHGLVLCFRFSPLSQTSLFLTGLIVRCTLFFFLVCPERLPPPLAVPGLAPPNHFGFLVPTAYRPFLLFGFFLPGRTFCGPLSPMIMSSIQQVCFSRSTCASPSHTCARLVFIGIFFPSVLFPHQLLSFTFARFRPPCPIHNAISAFLSDCASLDYLS